MITFKMAKTVVNKGKNDCKFYLYGRSKREIIEKLIRLRAERKIAIERRDHIQAIRLDAIIKRWQLIIDQDDSNLNKWEANGAYN